MNKYFWLNDMVCKVLDPQPRRYNLWFSLIGDDGRPQDYSETEFIEAFCQHIKPGGEVERTCSDCYGLGALVVIRLRPATCAEPEPCERCGGTGRQRIRIKNTKLMQVYNLLGEEEISLEQSLSLSEFLDVNGYRPSPISSAHQGCIWLSVSKDCEVI